MSDWADWNRGVIPEGYHVESTGTAIAVFSTHWFRRTAERSVRKNVPSLPSYRLVIERKRLFSWEVIAYQNILVANSTPGDPRDPGISTEYQLPEDVENLAIETFHESMDRGTPSESVAVLDAVQAVAPLILGKPTEVELRLGDVWGVVQSAYPFGADGLVDEDRMEAIEEALASVGLGGFFSALQHAFGGSSGCVEPSDWEQQRRDRLEEMRVEEQLDA